MVSCKASLSYMNMLFLQYGCIRMQIFDFICCNASQSANASNLSKCKTANIQLMHGKIEYYNIIISVFLFILIHNQNH